MTGVMNMTGKAIVPRVWCGVWEGGTPLRREERGNTAGRPIRMRRILQLALQRARDVCRSSRPGGESGVEAAEGVRKVDIALHSRQA
jgi:hypothetical protein